MAHHEQYYFPDIRQLMAGKPHFSKPLEPFSGHRNLIPQPHYESLFPMADFGNVTSGYYYGNEGGNNNNNNSRSSGSRWPRQETLTLLEIRSRLDFKFKEANHKGPLWDEVSRIMGEEHGYQRSGKKCREKFENLYKYYKKTKVGKGGRQDGKNYRFFRQLEAIYGETTNQTKTHLTNHQENLEDHQKFYGSLSFSNSSEIETSSCSESYNNDLSAIVCMNQFSEKVSEKYERKSLKSRVKEYIEMEMRKLIDKQEVWMEKMMKTIEDKEEERMIQEDEWRKQEIARYDREHELWAKKRAWVKARDVALLDRLKKPSGKSLIDRDHAWTEDENPSLVQLITSNNGGRFEESWEEIAAKMGTGGYDLSVDECKEKGENLTSYVNMTGGSNKKQFLPYADEQDVFLNDGGSQVHDSYLKILMMNEGEFWWQKYGLKVSKVLNKNKNSL